MAGSCSNGQSSVEEKVPSEHLFISISVYRVFFFHCKIKKNGNERKVWG